MTSKNKDNSLGLDPLLVGNVGIRILKSMRKIIRAVDLHSRKLNQEFKVTVPQMVCIHALIEAGGSMTCSALAKNVELSGSTVNGILDRLENKGLASRKRDHVDRRIVFVQITEKGRSLCDVVPSLLQDRLSFALKQLPGLEQATIALTLERIVELMDVQDLDAAPHLIPSSPLNEQE